MKNEVLLVEDDLDLGMVVSGYLRLKGFAVQHVQTAEDALRFSESHATQLALAIIDVQLPEKDGFELARQLNQRFPHLLFMFLTARISREDRLRGLELGAVDYVTKPFEIEELVLRVKNMVEKVAVPHAVPKDWTLGDLTYQRSRFCLTMADGSESVLTLREAEVLNLLNSRPNQVVSKSDMLQQIWGEDNYFNGKSLEVIISRLRSILKKSKCVTIDSQYGVGYILRIVAIG